MKTIHKLQLPLNMGQTVKYTLPFNARIISVGMQYGSLMVWYITDTAMGTKEQRTFHIIKTGDELPSGIERVNFIGTAQSDYDPDRSYFVVHLFEGELVN